MQSTRVIAPPGAQAEGDDAGVTAGVLVSVTPRRRVRSQADVVRLIFSRSLRIGSATKLRRGAIDFSNEGPVTTAAANRIT